MSKKNKPQDVFRFINTHNNDPSVCWEWMGSTGGRDDRGYFSVDGKKWQAHRLVYTLMNGEIPDGIVIRHTCDNPICCNPTHLEPGTRSQNEKDKYDRDRQGYPRDVVVQIKRLAKLSMTYQQIADEIKRKFGITISASGVGKVVRGERRA